MKLAHGLFVELQFEATRGRVSGETFTTSNGVTIARDDLDASADVFFPAGRVTFRSF